MATDPITLCALCFRPEATDEQWKTVPEDEGEELCWGRGANCENIDTFEVLLARVVELAAERDELLARLAAPEDASTRKTMR